MKRGRALDDRKISHMIKFNMEIPSQARKVCQQKSTNYTDKMKHSENYGADFRKSAVNGTYNRYRQFTINRIFKLSCRLSNPSNQVKVVKIDRLKTLIKYERQMRSKLFQKDTPNMLQPAKQFLVKSQLEISSNLVFDPKVLTGSKRKRKMWPWGYQKINDFQNSELDSIRTSICDGVSRDVKNLCRLFRSSKPRIMRCKFKKLKDCHSR